jgi:hypothetical protein
MNPVRVIEVFALLGGILFRHVAYVARAGAMHKLDESSLSKRPRARSAGADLRRLRQPC